MRSYLTIFVGVFLILFAFVLFNISPLISAPAAEEGRVLGIFEENKAMDLNELRAKILKLPKGDEIKEATEEPHIPIPILKSSSDALSLPGCKSVLVDVNSGTDLFAQDADKVVPVASITKLATALTFLDFNPGWDKEVTINGEDIVGGGKIYLVRGDIVKVKDLFYLSLIGSANTATRALARSIGVTGEEFVIRMNNKMAELGLNKTNFVDTIGFSYRNVSSAKEIAFLASVALAKEEISEATKFKTYSFSTKQGRQVTVKTTNWLLENYPNEEGVEIIGGKTGYTALAGYCFVGKFIDTFGNELISVVLGTPDKNSRFKETKNLVTWAYNNYIWQ